MSRSTQIQNLLSRSVDDHRCYLIPRKSKIFEANILFYHFIKNFIRFFRDYFRGLFIFDNRFIMFALKQNPISQVHLNIVNGQNETKVPLIKSHDHPLSLYYIIISRTLKLGHPSIIPLHIINKDQSIINFIIFTSN